MPIIQGRKQQTAIPMRHATAMQIITKSVSAARNAIQSLQSKTTSKPININKRMRAIS
jgi:hypothetical protein